MKPLSLSPTDQGDGQRSLADFGEERLDSLQRRAFEYFLHQTSSLNGLVADTSERGSDASVAAVGFALASYPVGIERGHIRLLFDGESGHDGGVVELVPDVGHLDSMGVQWRCNLDSRLEAGKWLPSLPLARL